MVFKVLEAEHLQGRQIEQKLDSILFVLLIIAISSLDKTTYLFYLFCILNFPPSLQYIAWWKPGRIRHERHTRLAQRLFRQRNRRFHSG